MNLKKRGNVWYLVGRLNGERKRISTGCRDRSKAEAQVPRILSEIAQEAESDTGGGLTLSKGFQKLSVAENRSMKTDYRGWLTRTKQIEEFLGPDTPLQDIDDDAITSLQHHLMTQTGKGGRLAAPATVNRKMAELKHLLMYAWKRWHVLKMVPHFEKLKVHGRKRRALTEREIDLLMENTRPKFRFLWRFLIETGLRTGEWLQLEWEDFDLDEGKLRLVPGRRVYRDGEEPKVLKIKTDSERSAWLSEPILEELRELRESGAERPLGAYSQQTVKTEWNRVRRKLGLERDDLFVPYSLRHTCATRLVSRGIPTSTVQKWMGHANIATTTIYLDQSDEDMKACVQAVSLGEPRTSAQA